MHISELQIHNYKGFNTSAAFSLKPGFNIVTGANNTGKTALLEALTLRFPLGARPYRSLEVLPERDSTLPPVSSVRVAIEMSLPELKELQIKRLHSLHIPLPANYSSLPFQPFAGIHDGSFHQQVWDWFFSHDDFTLQFTVDHEKWDACGNTTFGLYDAPDGRGITRNFSWHSEDDQGRVEVGGPTTGADKESDFGFKLFPILRDQIYYFRAERVIGRCSTSRDEVLESNGSNLAAVLDNLQRNSAKMTRFNALVREVLPQLLHVSVLDMGDNEREVAIWLVDPATEREDLTVPLSECGTGVGQVLAMLYVVFTSRFARTLLIDEPQSFLHPGALPRLFDVLKTSYPQHQYVVATHSPTLITSTAPAHVLLVKQTNGQSQVVPMQTEDAEQMQEYFAEVGIRASDVFGADRVLWVEGPTEEEAFPLLWRHFLQEPLLGTAILGVKSTGDLQGKHAERIYDIYAKLTDKPTLLPPAVAFVFDREKTTEQERRDLMRKSKKLVHFLPRRLYENYLLDPKALAALLNEIDAERLSPVSISQVEGWIQGHKSDKRYGASEAGLSEADWTIQVDGARLLADLVGELSENRVEFSKTAHSIWLTKQLLLNAPETLTELGDLLKACVSLENDATTSAGLSGLSAARTG